MAASCPSVPELREALAKAEAQHADNQEALQTAGHQGQHLLAEEQALRQSLESCRQELEQAAEERSTPVSEKRPQARAQHELERLQLRNQLMAEELEEHENARSRSISTPRRHRGKSQSEDGRVRLQELNQELAEIKTAEEEAARGWAQAERLLASEVLEAEESEAKMLKQMREKLKQIKERNDLLKEELRSEEAKTQGKTLSLQTAVGQLRAELKCWSTGGGSPSHSQNRHGHGSSAGSEVWSGRASESSLGSGSHGSENSRGSRGSENSESQGLNGGQRKPRRRPTSSFKPLEQMVATKPTETRSEHHEKDETETSSASTALRSLRSSVSGLMDDALLRVGELLQDSGSTVKESKMEPIAETKFEQEDVSEGSAEALTDFWKGNHRESASAAFAHFGALLQQQVSSAAEMAATAMPSRG
ncbi:unnamed protein product [Symbiodinium necroappetens]|uniref:Uncharacterized protein n=1 Tax=Symbiodinium necroappetens TaxID=1628268 RepID=A0A812SFV4_9DINO|nr:unnamed protein product [Symbiodinium necroappetens]